jgi:hypothetical protein
LEVTGENSAAGFGAVGYVGWVKGWREHAVAQVPARVSARGTCVEERLVSKETIPLISKQVPHKLNRDGPAGVSPRGVGFPDNYHAGIPD